MRAADRAAGICSLSITLPVGTAEISRAEAELLASALRSFGPPGEMPTATSAAGKIDAVLEAVAACTGFTCGEQYEILLALDRLIADGDLTSLDSRSLRHLLALQLAWQAQEHAKDMISTTAHEA